MLTNREMKNNMPFIALNSIRYPHQLKGPADYITQINTLLELVDVQIREAAQKIAEDAQLDIRNIDTINRMKYYLVRLSNMKAMLRKLDRTRWKQIIGETELLIRKTNKALYQVS